MESLQSSIQSLVTQINKEIFSLQDVYTFVSPAAYDTAWLAMIPDPKNSNQPMFESCLDWVLKNQNEGGFWGVDYGEGLPTIDTLPAALACMIALRTWNVGDANIAKGLAFIYSKAEIILKVNYHHLPRWFVIVFPAMVELARAKDLDIVFPQGSKSVLADLFYKRQQILEMEDLVDDLQNCAPLLSYLECLPSAFHVDQQNILKHLAKDGSLFQSPSATACAYMATGNLQCMEYLWSLVQKCPHGVPTKFPMDEELIKLCTADHVQRVGLAEHFTDEIEEILKQVYMNQRNDQEVQPAATYDLPAKLYKNALAFRLLRMQGYDVKPSCFCWFLHHAEILDYIEQNCERLTSVLYTVYRATDLTFLGEYELEEARSFSRKLLEKSMASKSRADDFAIFHGLQKVIKHELSLPWITRLDHLEHRMWIEENKTSPLWMGKASFYRLFFLHNERLMELASKNFKFRQLIYAKELEELTRWSKETGFSDIGFGRERTAYCYFAVSASSCLPLDSIVRLLTAKSAIIITVADDFYDMEGSLTELEILTEAVQRWDGKNLSGHSKTIFDALDDFVTNTAAEYGNEQGSKFLTKLKDIWRETFASWMVEKQWSDSGYLASKDDYLDTGMVSIGVHTLALPASCFLNKRSPNKNLKPMQCKKITKLLMASARLLNDTQSYQKEQQDGKMNYVMLHLKQNPEAHIDDSIAYVKDILEEKTKEFLELVLMDRVDDDTPKSSKQFHLSCMKVFHMFFNSTNLFDSEDELMQDIKKAIYIPLETQTPDFRVKPPQSVPQPSDLQIKPIPSVSKIRKRSSKPLLALI